MSPETAARTHKVAAALWLVLALVTTTWALWDPENKYLLAWLVFMSGYANVASHLSGAAGAGPSSQES